MKLGTCRYRDSTYLFVAVNDHLVLPALDPRFDQPRYRDLLACIAAGGITHGLLEQCGSETELALDEIELLAPIPRPAKNVMCLGWNYSEHIKETSEPTGRSADLPEHPIVFTKAVTSVVGPDAVVPYNAEASSELDWEIELGVIIGRGGKGIRAEDAFDHVFGYTVINDISARDLQFRHKQFFIGKSLDGACPMGPWIVTADDIADPQDLDLKCWVNGELKQDSNTRYMIFDIPTIIATLSRGMPLEPGDIIATGTPDGVGFARKPPEYLRPGDTVECHIEGVGRITNRVV
jgi:2-keto-4-pentenoate hydratase/2-oxohepta-3-ene-1,7-dioic acid hydratase in catechol pathway